MGLDAAQQARGRFFALPADESLLPTAACQRILPTAVTDLQVGVW